MKHPSRILLALSLAVSAAGAHAGQFEQGNWQAASCGPKPPLAALDLRDPDAYNKSLEGVNAYRLAIRSWLDCLAQEGNADVRRIADAVKAEQDAARLANDRILADAKAADAKFGEAEGKGK